RELNASRCPAWHNTTGSFRTIAPASFKRLLGRSLDFASIEQYPLSDDLDGILAPELSPKPPMPSMLFASLYDDLAELRVVPRHRAWAVKADAQHAVEGERVAMRGATVDYVEVETDAALGHVHRHGVQGARLNRIVDLFRCHGTRHGAA